MVGELGGESEESTSEDVAYNTTGEADSGNGFIDVGSFLLMTNQLRMSLNVTSW